MKIDLPFLGKPKRGPSGFYPNFAWIPTRVGETTVIWLENYLAKPNWSNILGRHDGTEYLYRGESWVSKRSYY